MSSQHLPILAIGDCAANILLPDSEGSILATFSKVTYLRHALDEVIWFVTEEAPMHRRAIQLAGSFPEFSVNTPYFVKNNVLMLESGAFLDFNTVKIWKTPYLSPGDALPIKDLYNHLVLSFSSFDDFPAPAGMGIFITEILDPIQDLPMFHITKDTELTTSQRFAQPMIYDIARACRTQDFNGIFEHGEELIGLGEGLTPSGDDFMGGLLFCIRTLQDLYEPFHTTVFKRLENYVAKMKSRTNLISYTMLKEHASGHSSETLHSFIHVLLTGWDIEMLSLLGSELIQMGHSTGWDLLTGVLTGMLLISDYKSQNTFRTDPSSSHHFY